MNASGQTMRPRFIRHWTNFNPRIEKSWCSFFSKNSRLRKSLRRPAVRREPSSLAFTTQRKHYEPLFQGESMNNANEIRRQLLSQIPQPENLSEYRSRVAEIIQRDQKRLHVEHVVTTVFWIFC